MQFFMLKFSFFLFISFPFFSPISRALETWKGDFHLKLKYHNFESDQVLELENPVKATVQLDNDHGHMGLYLSHTELPYQVVAFRITNVKGTSIGLRDDWGSQNAYFPYRNRRPSELPVLPFFEDVFGVLNRGQDHHPRFLFQMDLAPRQAALLARDVLDTAIQGYDSDNEEFRKGILIDDVLERILDLPMGAMGHHTSLALGSQFSPDRPIFHDISLRDPENPRAGIHLEIDRLGFDSHWRLLTP